MESEPPLGPRADGHELHGPGVLERPAVPHVQHRQAGEPRRLFPRGRAAAGPASPSRANAVYRERMSASAVGAVRAPSWAKRACRRPQHAASPAPDPQGQGSGRVTDAGVRSRDAGRSGP